MLLTYLISLLHLINKASPLLLLFSLSNIVYLFLVQTILITCLSHCYLIKKGVWRKVNWRNIWLKIHPWSYCNMVLPIGGEHLDIHLKLDRIGMRFQTFVILIFCPEPILMTLSTAPTLFQWTSNGQGTPPFSEKAWYSSS